jgi:hypothetical protein
MGGRENESTNLQRTVSACLEYLAAATNPSPLAQLAREALMRELNQLQIEIGRGLHLVPRRARPQPLFEEGDVAIDTAPQGDHRWTAAELSEAIALLPDGLFAGHHLDRVSQQVTRREHLGLSLLRALEANRVVEPVGVTHAGEEDPRGPFLRFRKV